MIGVLLILAALVSYGFAYTLSGPLQQRNGALPVVWRALGVAVILTAPLGVPVCDRRTLVAMARRVAGGARGRRHGHRLCHDRDGSRTNGRDRRVGQQLHHSGRGARARRRTETRAGVVDLDRRGRNLPARRVADQAGPDLQPNGRRRKPSSPA